MHDPIAHLLQEHKDIMAQVADLRRAVSDLWARGDAAVPEALPVLHRIGKMMATQLARHAQKEDDGLFPALEAIFGTGGGPTTVMRSEHRAIHEQGELLRRTLHEINAVEHPAIEAGSERLRGMPGSAEAATMRATAEEVIRLLDVHFAKEEQVLFPMALNLLDDQALAEVARRMEAVA